MGFIPRKVPHHLDQTSCPHVIHFMIIDQDRGSLASSTVCSPDCQDYESSDYAPVSTGGHIIIIEIIIMITRPKPAFGRQGLDWDRWARIQFSQVHFGAKTSLNQQGGPTDLLWSKNVTATNRGSD